MENREIIGQFMWNKIREWQEILKKAESEKAIYDVLEEIKNIPINESNYQTEELKNNTTHK